MKVYGKSIGGGSYNLKPGTKLFYSYVAFLILYTCFTLFPEPSKATLLQYHVSVPGFRFIELTIIVILAVIWYVAFYGYAQLSEYSALIHGEPDGKQVALLSRGVFLIAMWLPVFNVSSAVLDYVATHYVRLGPSVAIINNYVSLALPLAGFVFVSLGAHGLSMIAKKRPTYRAINTLVLFVIYGGLLYYHLVVTTPDRSIVYHLPIILILLTIVAPYLYMWYLGVKAAFEIYNYRRNIRGALYKRAWRLLAFGLGWLIGTSVIFQYLTTLVSHLLGLSIYWILAIVYVLLLILAVGFVLISQGTKKLRRIEEV